MSYTIGQATSDDIGERWQLLDTWGFVIDNYPSKDKAEEACVRYSNYEKMADTVSNLISQWADEYDYDESDIRIQIIDILREG